METFGLRYATFASDRRLRRGVLDAQRGLRTTRIDRGNWMPYGRVESLRESHASLDQIRSGQTRGTFAAGSVCPSGGHRGQVGARSERRIPLQTLPFCQPTRNCRVPTVQSTIWTQERYGVRVPTGHVLWSDEDHRQWSGGSGDDNSDSTSPED